MMADKYLKAAKLEVQELKIEIAIMLWELPHTHYK